MGWLVTLIGILATLFVALMIAAFVFISPGRDLKELDKQIAKLEIEKQKKEIESAKILAEIETIEEKIAELEAQKLQILEVE